MSACERLLISPGIPLAVVLGESEIAKGVVKVGHFWLRKHMKYSHCGIKVRSVNTREEVEVPRKELVANLR